MSHDITLIIGLAAPVIVLTLFGVNAAVVFLSLCLGEVLVKYVATDALSMAATFSSHVSAMSKSSIQLIFLYAPAVATTVFMLRSVKGRIARLVNILPAAGVGLLGILMGVPLFTPGLRHAIESGPLWGQLVRAQALVVGAAAFTSLLFLWSQRSSLRRGEKRASRRRD